MMINPRRTIIHWLSLLGNLKMKFEMSERRREINKLTGNRSLESLDVNKQIPDLSLLFLF